VVLDFLGDADTHGGIPWWMTAPASPAPEVAQYALAITHPVADFANVSR